MTGARWWRGTRPSCGDEDFVIGGADESALRTTMAPTVADLRDVVLIPGVGHWVQQEAPGATSDALLTFLRSVDRD
jgi:pimeloyl-ACP methyl ester carboxylesterase